jgi:hypothetical protein
MNLARMDDAKVGDIYVDDNGVLWRVVGVVAEPSVTLAAVEPRGVIAGGALGGIGQQGLVQPQGLAAASLLPRENKSAGVSAVMWQGFTRIWRRPEHKEAAE